MMLLTHPSSTMHNILTSAFNMDHDFMEGNEAGQILADERRKVARRACARAWHG